MKKKGNGKEKENCKEKGIKRKVNGERKER